MINYETYSKIRLYYRERGLNFSQIGRELGIDPETVAKYARAESYTLGRRPARRPSKLDVFKPTIQRWLERHPYIATQIMQRLRSEEGYTGGFSILKQYVKLVRPVHHPAFLTLAFAPGESAQVDCGVALVLLSSGRPAAGSPSL
jgi:transposase